MRHYHKLRPVALLLRTTSLPYANLPQSQLVNTARKCILRWRDRASDSVQTQNAECVSLAPRGRRPKGIFSGRRPRRGELVNIDHQFAGNCAMLCPSIFPEHTRHVAVGPGHARSRRACTSPTWPSYYAYEFNRSKRRAVMRFALARQRTPIGSAERRSANECHYDFIWSECPLHFEYPKLPVRSRPRATGPNTVANLMSALGQKASSQGDRCMSASLMIKYFPSKRIRYSGFHEKRSCA